MLLRTGVSNRTDTLVNNRNLNLGSGENNPSPFSLSAARVSDIIFDALIDMGIKQDGFSWDINVTVEQNNE